MRFSTASLALSLLATLTAAATITCPEPFKPWCCEIDLRPESNYDAYTVIRPEPEYASYPYSNLGHCLWSLQDKPNCFEPICCQPVKEVNWEGKQVLQCGPAEEFRDN